MKTHRTFDIHLVRLLNFSNHLFGGRIDSFESLATSRLHEFVVDKQTSFEFRRINRHGILAVFVVVLVAVTGGFFIELC
jgi:hypothetical protein